MNGDEVRSVRFPATRGYDASQVDDLLRRLTVELDAGRPAGPLIANATFRPSGRSRGYEIDAVDWFLEQLRGREDHAELAGLSGDPWRDLAVVNHFTHSGPGELAGRIGAPSQRERRRDVRRDREYLSQECAKEWRGFGQQPGTHLRWVGVIRRELRTADQQPIASLRREQATTISTGGRTFTRKRVTGSSWPGIAEIAARSSWDRDGHFLAAGAQCSWKRQAKSNGQKPSSADRAAMRELLDEAGMPALYTSGTNLSFRACARITFPNQRWLRFPVRGTNRGNAIMTAVDQAGNKIARYRASGGGLLRNGSWPTMEITVHPSQRLTDELVLAIAISAPWLDSYFKVPA